MDVFEEILNLCARQRASANVKQLPLGLTCPIILFMKDNFVHRGDVSNKPLWIHGEVIWHPQYNSSFTFWIMIGIKLKKIQDHQNQNFGVSGPNFRGWGNFVWLSSPENVDSWLRDFCLTPPWKCRFLNLARRFLFDLPLKMSIFGQVIFMWLPPENVDSWHWDFCLTSLLWKCRFLAGKSGQGSGVGSNKNFVSRWYSLLLLSMNLAKFPIVVPETWEMDFFRS